MHAVPRVHARCRPALVAGEVPLLVVVLEQLRKILVGRHDHRAQAVPARSDAGGSDEVVGLEIGVCQHHQAERLAHRLAVHELTAQRVGRGVAVGLVGGIERVAKAAVEGLVEGHRNVHRALALDQFQQEPGEALDRIGRMALAVCELVGDRMPRAEYVQAGIHQVDRRARRQPGERIEAITHAGVQSDNNSAASGRSRSGASMEAVPMWMKPATASSAFMPSRVWTCVS